jgi:hypothetical protein
MAWANWYWHGVWLLATVLLGLLRGGLSHGLHPADASLLPWGQLSAGAGWEHTLHQLLHSQEVSAIGMHMPAQLLQVLTLQQDKMYMELQFLGLEWCRG